MNLKFLKIGSSILLNHEVVADAPVKRLSDEVDFGDINKMQKNREEKEEEKTEIQTEAIESVGEIVAKFTELNAKAFQNAKPEIRELSEDILKKLSLLSSSMNATVVKQIEE